MNFNMNARTNSAGRKWLSDVSLFLSDGFVLLTLNVREMMIWKELYAILVVYTVFVISSYQKSETPTNVSTKARKTSAI
eukprot:COSAG02_NODE_1004_length_15275_cov_11.955917_4_plen_79_part_00